MKMKAKALYIFILIGFILLGINGYTFAFIGEDIKIEFRHITSVNGLSNNTVYDISQDAEGFVWIATREGLNKFDGKVITSYYKNQAAGIPNNVVEQLIHTSSGKLIVGTQSGACFYNKVNDSFLPLLYNGRSLENITRLYELSTGELLISSTEGLFLSDTNLSIKKISEYEIRDMCEYKTGIIFGLYEDEILLMNTEGEIIRRYSAKMNNVGNFDLSATNIECVFKDSRGTIWFGTKRDGLGYYNLETDKFFNLKLQQSVNLIEDNFIRIINEDNTGRLWIGTESGLYIYDVKSGTSRFYGQSFVPSEKGLNDKAIYSIFRSRDNLMWLGTYFGGINYTSLSGNGFKSIYADGGITGLSGNAVSEIIETSDGRIWIATEDGGINILDPKTGLIEYLKHNPGQPNSLSSNNVHALEEDEDGNIWIGTFLGGLNKYNIKKNSVESIDLIPPGENMQEDVYSKSLFSIFIDSKKRIWAGSIEGLYMREEEDAFKIWNPDYFQNNFIYHIDEDHDGNIWICTYEQGIYKIDTELKVSNFRYGRNYDIQSNRIVYCYIDSDDIIWFGTVDGGLLKFDVATSTFKTYMVNAGLANNTVYAILKDSTGHLWLSTNRGISMFHPEEEKFVNYSVDDGLIGNQFNFKSGLITSTGILYFGAVNGLNYFDPQKLSNDIYKPEIHFTDFKIFNTPVTIGDDNILNSHINFQDLIRLKHRHKVFTIDFVALNFLAPDKIQYAYYMEGLEDEWNLVGNTRSATYTNLSPGKYIFHLKASSDSDINSAKERMLTIYISPPFWTSVWGFTLYAFIFITSIIALIRFSIIRQKEKMNIRLASLEQEKNEEISKHRLNFFTYISHEFKTPLTLIIATLEQIMYYEDILPRFKDYGVMIRKNAMRLLFLINQLMDFRKIETDHAELRFNKGEIIGFIKSTFDSFNPLMKKRFISSKFSSNLDSYIVYFEADKLEKILSNLISNSCKSFTKPGTISVNVIIAEQQHPAHPSSLNGITGDLIITVSDDGPGLPEEKLGHLFSPFDPGGFSDINSSGIGLALVNSLVKYLNGQIHIRSSVKEGTAITIQLPLIHNPSPELIKNNSFIESNKSIDLENTEMYLDSEPVISFDHADDGSFKEYEILIVEDNKELATFLGHHFMKVFKVQLASDGLEALKKIKKSHPDLIISDIMMPLMDGYSLCNTIKGSIETSHIPVILLTSKTSDEAVVAGLNTGADAYIGKPFNLKELDLHIRNILRYRENLRKHFASFSSGMDNLSELGNRDQMFIKKLSNIVIKHLDDGNFDVDMFCNEVNVSRTLLHIKLKKITGLSTTAFISKIRMSEAKKMLDEGLLSVSEISYRVGYNDPAYFSKSFKKMFGKSPSEMSN